jgi:SAM-dependent methyltransferase
MKNWAQKEQQRYNDIYKNKKHYGVSDFEDYAKFFPEIKSKNWAVLDLACGAAHLSKEYSNYTGIDISTNAVKRNRENLSGLYYVGNLGDLRRWYGWKYDAIFANDVMEHIPREMTALVLSEISRIDSKAYYFKIHKGKSNFSDEQGNLHRTIESHEFWHNLISNYFKIDEEFYKGKGMDRGYLSYFRCKKKN